MKKIINDYEFTDCLLIDFGIDKRLSNVYVVVEAFYKLEADCKRKKGLLKIEFKNLFKISIDKTDEFEFDINQPYDKDGNDVKANELYSIEIFVKQENRKVVKLNSDMLNLEIEFVDITIDFFKEPVDVTKPHIIIYPRP